MVINMSKHKYTTVICAAVVIIMLVTTVAFMASRKLGVTVAHTQPVYAQKLFSTDKVHTIDIVVKESDWDEMITNALDEEYIQCSVVIDGEAIKGVGIRPKGNSSLSMIEGSDSDRYSFKVEFDHYEKGKSYFGLDKLALNNIAQDNTYMKDYISYQMMNAMGADAPLSSFIWVTVNGQNWGLYLAAEGIEESFAQRVYGSSLGNLYKPDTMDMGEGLGGNGGEGFQRNNQMPEGMPAWDGEIPDFGNMPQDGLDQQSGEVPDFGTMPQGGWDQQSSEVSDLSNMPQNGQNQQGGKIPDFENTQKEEQDNQDNVAADVENIADEEKTQQDEEMLGLENIPNGQKARQGGGMQNFGGGFGGRGMSSSVSLIYTDDDPESYAAIFDNAKFDTSNADKARLIASLKQLNEGENIQQVVNVDEVIRYFVVHNFVLNSDSYTGSLTHNYYLYEKDGQLSMIAWDYNLAFGGMGGVGNAILQGNTTSQDNDDIKSSDSQNNATTLVNYPIDSPMLSGSVEDKPMIAWIFDNEEYLAEYHEIFGEFMEYFNSGEFAAMYDNAIALISPYVSKDPSAFCTYEDFQKGNTALREFCLLRAESINGQLNGTIASTSEGQTETENAGFIDASDVDVQSMGSNSMGFGRARGGFTPEDGQSEVPQRGENNGEAMFPNIGIGADRASFTSSTEYSISPSEVILLLVCIVTLSGGILFAKKWWA